MGKTSKQTSNQTSTSTTTPINPSWVEPGIEAMFGNIGELGKRDPASFIPGASTLQQLAFGQAPGLAGAGSDYNIMANAYGQRAADWQPAMVTAGRATAPGALGVSKASMDPSGMAAASTAGASGYTAAQLDPNALGSATSRALTDVDLKKYSDPYLESVIKAFQAESDYSDGRALTAYQAKAGGTGAFGGSGYSLGLSDLGGQLGRSRTTNLANLLSDSFKTSQATAGLDLNREASTSATNAGLKTQGYLANLDAANDASQFSARESNESARQNAQLGTQASLTNAGLLSDLSRFNAGAQNDASKLQYSTLAELANANADRDSRAGETNASAWNAGADRALSAAGLFGDLASNTADSARKNTALLGDLGSQQRAVAGEQAMAPLTIQQLLAQTMGQLPLNLLHGESTNGTQTGTTTSKESDPIGTASKLISSAALLFSDERLKTNVETVGYDAKGRRWVDYSYVWSPEERQRGVVAQEVAKTDPHAVQTGPGGFLMVDYNKLEQA